jgi:hypothetical protein
VATAVHAEPWLAPGNIALRSDIGILADRGIVNSPITTWPVSWPDVARDVLAVEPTRELDAVTNAALQRVQDAARRAMRSHELEFSAAVRGAEKPLALRTFEATPREEGELELAASWMSDRFVVNLQATGVANPSDDKSFRADGSYVGVNIANVMISAGYPERWWGPGWEGSLILSNNARPLPGLTIERNYSDPFSWRILHWIGPWRASLVFAGLEDHRDDFDHARFFGARVTFKPLKQLEIGLSRTALWCGKGRPCGGGTFVDLLLGRDNDQPLPLQPGDQLAGYDARWASSRWPIALYGQMIGEDEAGFLPSKFLGLFGAESWFALAGGTTRVHFEYADTSCSFSRQNPQFNCAYESSIYTVGYRFRGRSIGHALDGDGRMYSFGAVWTDAQGRSWELLARRMDLNRDATTAQSGHTLAALATKLDEIELRHARSTPWGDVSIGLGHDDMKGPALTGAETGFRAFIDWRYGF